MSDTKQAWQEVAHCICAITHACDELNVTDEFRNSFIAVLFVLLTMHYSGIPINCDIKDSPIYECYLKCVVALDRADLMREAKSCE